MELRTEFLEHSLRQAAELAGKAASSDDLQHALEICRKSMEYYRWHKDSLPAEARDRIAEQLAQITEQLARLIGESFAAREPNTD